jgi:hypothetical protein
MSNNGRECSINISSGGIKTLALPESNLIRTAKAGCCLSSILGKSSNATTSSALENTTTSKSLTQASPDSIRAIRCRQMFKPWSCNCELEFFLRPIPGASKTSNLRANQVVNLPNVRARSAFVQLIHIHLLNYLLKKLAYIIANPAQINCDKVRKFWFGDMLKLESRVS